MGCLIRLTAFSRCARSSPLVKVLVIGQNIEAKLKPASQAQKKAPALRRNEGGHGKKKNPSGNLPEGFSADVVAFEKFPEKQAGDMVASALGMLRQAGTKPSGLGTEKALWLGPGRSAGRGWVAAQPWTGPPTHSERKSETRAP